MCWGGYQLFCEHIKKECDLWNENITELTGDIKFKLIKTQV